LEFKCSAGGLTCALLSSLLFLRIVLGNFCLSCSDSYLLLFVSTVFLFSSFLCLKRKGDFLLPFSYLFRVVICRSVWCSMVVAVSCSVAAFAFALFMERILDKLF
jgi:ABC-type spermidine/putrescine transport system permease subunit I